MLSPPPRCRYLCSTLVLRIIPGFGVRLCLSQLPQLPVQPKEATFILGLEGVHSHLQLLFALLQLLHLLTELLFGTCGRQMRVSLQLTERGSSLRLFFFLLPPQHSFTLAHNRPELTAQLVDFGLGSHEDPLSLFLFFGNLLSELLLSLSSLRKLLRKKQNKKRLSSKVKRKIQIKTA